MANIKTIQAGKYNQKLAEALKKEGHFKEPEWVLVVKSSPNRQRPIEEEDFWYKRAASILRQIYTREIVGVQRLRTRYGGRKDRGKQPGRFTKSGGKIIRSILQQGEQAGFLMKAEGKKKGRKLTDKGKQFLEKIADEAAR